MDWVYGQAIGFLGNFFALMGNMGVELFELEWVSAIILFVSRLAWALFSSLLKSLTSSLSLRILRSRSQKSSSKDIASR